ncbi:hypothetical protein VAE151_550090 [Vibrio aestuarianus]|uniref:Uncharacterized protein n=1 Tax=Vibrio aestuarianus TaxID=28171 RepID=A0ABM9FP75_9VIBR|nr:hypothetical protein VAE308_1050090 [Vibrio aestuarianus]CAH8191708.1 hypothetical protein VAE055_370090 [Vibrio aestuarianus]CAH8191746.1 hypothetical protein VAE032_270089 [Vibrio aestuarianus]CAH8191909.1 hypothetical protein VAE128_460090 [Vibrio aestuarianus]CAH8192161.1 hypothetical protein VAE130_570090 [Vibrio aestuarianus]
MYKQCKKNAPLHIYYFLLSFPFSNKIFFKDRQKYNNHISTIIEDDIKNIPFGYIMLSNINHSYNYLIFSCF